MNEELKIIISAQVDKLKQNVDKAKSSLQQFKDKVKEARKDCDENFKQIGTGIANGLKAGATAIAAAGAALIGLGAATEEYRKLQSTLITSFEAAGGSAAAAKDTYNDLYRVLGDGGKATEAAAHLAKLTTEEKALGEWTNTLKGVYATFGDTLPIEALTEAINHSSKLGSVQGNLADALEWSGISVDAFNEQLEACSTEGEREALIRQTLSGLYDDAASKYETNNKAVLDQNEAQAKLQETMAKVGEAVAPVITYFTNLANNALAACEPYITSFAEKYLPKLKDTLKTVGEKVGEVFTYLKENWQLLATLGGIIGGITAAITLYNIVAAVKAAMAAAEVTTVWGLVAAYAAQAVAMMVALAPYLLIVAAIAAVIAIIVLCVKHWDTIKETVVNVAKTVWEAIKNAWDWIANLFSTIGKWIYDNLITPVINFFKGLWEGIVNSFNTVIAPWIEIIKRAIPLIYEKIVKPILDYFVKLWADIKAVFAVVGNWFNEKVIQPVVGFFSKMWEGLKEGASKAWEGVKNVFSKVASFFGDIFSKAWEKVKNVFSVGGKIFEGIKEGIEKVFKTVVNSIIGGINKVITIPFKAINTALSKIKSIDILGVKPFTWIKTFSIPQIPKLENGGVLKKGQVGLLEGNGAEAVVPLEKNTEWLDRIAERLTASMGGSSPVILKVGEKVFGEVCVSSLNSITSQTGSLPLLLG